MRRFETRERASRALSGCAQSSVSPTVLTFLTALAMVLVSAASVQAQQPGPPAQASAQTAQAVSATQGAVPAAVPATQGAAQAYPNGFRGIHLGMEIEQVKNLLRTDPLFAYRGEPDVSFLPQTTQYLIECQGTSYLQRAYFQFQDSRLLTMILVLDPQKLDYYSLFSALSAKYGLPTSLDPQQSVWQSSTVRFSLERPVTVKYIDEKAFAALLKASTPPANLDQLSREKFIEQF